MMDVVKLAHLVSGIVWMGGMTCLLFALRPSALATLQPQPRALLMAQVWRRFFAWVMAAIVVLFATGTTMYVALFRATRLASGTGAVPLGWNLMLLLGVVMMLVFGHLYFGSFKKYLRAVVAAEWPVAAAAAAKIHRLVVTNFVLGWLAILSVRLVH